jgi:hypothetical protein
VGLLALVGVAIAIASYAWLARHPKAFRPFCWCQLAAAACMIPSQVAVGLWTQVLLSGFYVAISVGGLLRAQAAK